MNLTEGASVQILRGVSQADGPRVSAAKALADSDPAETVPSGYLWNQ